MLINLLHCDRVVLPSSTSIVFFVLLCCLCFLLLHPLACIGPTSCKGCPQQLLIMILKYTECDYSYSVTAKATMCLKQPASLGMVITHYTCISAIQPPVQSSPAADHQVGGTVHFHMGCHLCKYSSKLRVHDVEHIARYISILLKIRSSSTPYF